MRNLHCTVLLAVALPVLLLLNAAYAVNNAITFQPPSYIVSVSNVNTIPETNLTYEMWFKARGNTAGLFSIVASDPQVVSFDRCILIQNGRVRHYLWADNEGTEVIQSDNANFADNNWHHLAIVIKEVQGQQNGTYMYVDGNLERRGNFTHSRFDWADRIVIGYSPFPGLGVAYMTGEVDEFRMWNVALTQAEIRARMGSVLVGNEQNLIAYFRMDEGQGQAVADDSPNNFPMRFGRGGGADENDPRWVNPGAPISGAIADFDPDRIIFRPLGPGQSASVDFVLRNLAEQNDDAHRLTYQLTDRGGNPRWISIDPDDGSIDAGSEQVIRFTARTDGVQPGAYQRNVRLTSNALNFPIDINCRLNVADGVGSISGNVIDARTNEAVPGAIVHAIAEFDLQATTDENGRFAFEDIGTFACAYGVTMPDYLPVVSDTIFLENGEEAELNFELLHSEMRTGDESVEYSLLPDDTVTVSLDLRNPGNGPLTWHAALEYPEELLLEPWSLRQDYPIGAITEDDRLQAVAFVGDEFYIAGSAEQQKRIYVLNRDGELQRSFGQLSPSRYGFSGLTWDGELLWGAADQTIYGFTTEGDSATSFQGPHNPSNNVVWDSDRGLLWLASNTSNIVGCDREGNVVTTYNRRSMRMYGFGYYPEDPDGYQLYVYTNPEGNTQIIMKMDIEDGDTLRVTALRDGGGRPAGSTITNLFDPFAWVFMGINNLADGDVLNIFHLFAQVDWASLSEDEGIIEAGGSEEFFVHFDATGLQEDVVYQTMLAFHHDGIGGATEVPVLLSVTSEGGISQRNLSLDLGWNLVSVNLTPQVGEEGGSGFVEVVQPLVDAGVLIFAKDGAGNFYRPDAQFDRIGDWTGAAGYWLKVNAAASLRIPGIGIDADTPIELNQGWNTVAYLPRVPMQAPDALAGLGESLILARNGEGRFYLPAYNFSDMGRLREGFGYQVKVAEAGELVYGAGGRVAGLDPRLRGDDATSARSPYTTADLAWLEEIPRTGRMHHLLVKSSLKVGTRLEALTEVGIVAGRGVVGENGMAGVTLWGDDPETKVVEGLEEGEAIGKWKMENETTTPSIEGGDTPRLVAGEMAFTDGGWGVVELEGSAIPAEFGLTSLYPNPFNGTMKISFSLPGFGEAGLRVYDLAGREVAGLASGPYAAGIQSVVWNAEGLASGVYVVRLEAAGKVATRKVVLVR